MTLFASILQGLGLSQSEAADFLDVRIDTVKSWSAGRNRVPDGIIVQLRELARRQNAAASAIVETFLETSEKSGMPEAIEIALPSDAEVRRRGWPSTGAFLAIIRRAWERPELSRPIVVVPAGATESVRAAERMRKFGEP